MNILLVNSSDFGGGAEQAALGLLRSYRVAGHRAWFAVGRQVTNHEGVFAIDNDKYRSPWSRLWSQHVRPVTPEGGTPHGWQRWRQSLPAGLGEPVRAVRRRLGQDDFDFPGTRHLLESLPASIDLIHCHNLHGDYFDLRALSELSHQVPTVVTLHDAWMLSGHCAHSFDCDKWKRGCGACPDLTIYPAVPRDATAYNWRRKRAIYETSRLYVATPSRWLMGRVRESLLVRGIQDARVIPNGIDLTVFREGDRSAARAALALPQSARILLFVANGGRKNLFKDYETLRAALALVGRQSSERNLKVLGLGDGGPAELIGGIEVSFIPSEANRARVAMYYQAADIYIHAAKAETFPNSILEAAACGTSTIASAVGGVPEQIRDGQTGFLVPPADPTALAARIIQLLQDDALRQEMGWRAAASVKANHSTSMMSAAYLAWFDHILGLRSSAA